MISVFLFVLSVLAASVSGWGACQAVSTFSTSNRCSISQLSCNESVGCSQNSSSRVAGAASASVTSKNGSYTYVYNVNYSCNEGNYYLCSIDCQVVWWNSNTQYGAYCTVYGSLNKADADSVFCENNPSAPACSQDTTFHCQNTGGPEPGGITGYKTTATIYRQINGGVAVKTAELAGSCQDWGWCPDGVNDCDISKDSLGRNPCRRSGAEFISGSRCYYQCPDGTGLSCRPTSTDYVAGATWAARCPKLPTAECQPPHSSASSSPSSSTSVSSSSFKPPQDWEDPAGRVRASTIRPFLRLYMTRYTLLIVNAILYAVLIALLASMWVLSPITL